MVEKLKAFGESIGQKIWRMCRRSLTILLARLTTISGLLLLYLADVLADPNVNAAIKSVMGKWGPFYVIGAGVIFDFSRRRTARKIRAKDDAP